MSELLRAIEQEEAGLRWLLEQGQVDPDSAHNIAAWLAARRAERAALVELCPDQAEAVDRILAAAETARRTFTGESVTLAKRAAKRRLGRKGGQTRAANLPDTAWMTPLFEAAHAALLAEGRKPSERLIEHRASRLAPPARRDEIRRHHAVAFLKSRR